MQDRVVAVAEIGGDAARRPARPCPRDDRRRLRRHWRRRSTWLRPSAVQRTSCRSAAPRRGRARHRAGFAAGPRAPGRSCRPAPTSPTSISVASAARYCAATCGRCAGRAQRPVEPVADPAADAQRAGGDRRRLRGAGAAHRRDGSRLGAKSIGSTASVARHRACPVAPPLDSGAMPSACHCSCSSARMSLRLRAAMPRRRRCTAAPARPPPSSPDAAARARTRARSSAGRRPRPAWVEPSTRDPVCANQG